MPISSIILLIIITIGAIAAVAFKKLTTVAGIAGWVVAIILFAATGFYGVVLLAAFFILGNVATSAGIMQKQKLGLVEKEKGRRTIGQVFANAGMATFIGIVILSENSDHYLNLLMVMIAGSFSAATADTLSSEFGNIYGRRFYNILTFKKDTRGLDGVVSLEGTSAGIAGSIIIAFIHSVFLGFSSDFIIIVIAGTIGNIVDSVLGATVERKKLIGNNFVNFINTAAGALVVLSAKLVTL
jgi:uncharacterized protein (TIGR00297 family)